MCDLAAQRLLGLALGYEDINGHDTLRADSLLALAPGRADVTGRAGRAGIGPGRPLQAQRGRCGRAGLAAVVPWIASVGEISG